MSLRRLLAKATVPREPAPLEAGSKPAVAYAVATPRRRIPDSIAPEVPVLDESLSDPCCSTSTLEAVVRLSVLLLVLSLTLGAVSVFAADPQPDPSGIATGTGSDLAGVAPGTLTSDDFDSAAAT